MVQGVPRDEPLQYSLFSIHTADGPESLNLVFETPECKAEWESELTKVKGRGATG